MKKNVVFISMFASCLDVSYCFCNILFFQLLEEPIFSLTRQKDPNFDCEHKLVQIQEKVNVSHEKLTFVGQTEADLLQRDKMIQLKVFSLNVRELRSQLDFDTGIDQILSSDMFILYFMLAKFKCENMGYLG
jgi:hypothetical protein